MGQARRKELRGERHEARLVHPVPSGTKKAAAHVFWFVFGFTAMVVVAGVGSLLAGAVMP